MDHKKAATILINLLKNHPLKAEEKEAVKTAIGILAWTLLSKNKIKSLKAKRDRFTNQKDKA